MANGIICTNELVTASGVTFTHSTEVAGYEAENVQIYQPGESFRTSVLDPGWLQADFGPVQAFDTVGVLYTNATAHRCLLKQSSTLNTSPWTKTNITVTEGSESSIPVGGLGQGCFAVDDATAGEHKDVQTWTPPGTGGLTHTSMTLSGFVAGAVGQEITECRLRIEDSASNYAYADFDLSAGTASAVSTGGSNPFTLGAASISAVDSAVGSANWFEIALTGRPGYALAESFTVTIYLMDGGGNISYSGSSDILLINGMMLELGSNRSSFTASYGTFASFPTATTTDTGALISVTDSAGGIAGSEWGHLVAGDLSARSFVHWVHKYTSTIYGDRPNVWIFDPDNLDGYIEIGNFVVARAFQPVNNIGNDWTIGWAEEGSSSRAPGGQMYRPVNKRYRRMSMTHSWLTEAEAMEESFEIDRRVGRSEGVLAAVDPDSDYAHQWSIWGLQDSVSDTLHRRYVTGMGTRAYAKEWTIIEALP